MKAFLIAYCGSWLVGKTSNMEILHKSSLKHSEIASDFRLEYTTNTHPFLFKKFQDKSTLKSHYIASTLSFQMMMDFHRREISLKVTMLPTFACREADSVEAEKKIRQNILSQVDGLIWVIDSQKYRVEHNKDFWKELQNISTIEYIPLVIQYNKRDLPHILSIHDLSLIFNPDKKYSEYEAITIKGKGVLQTLEGLLEKFVKI
jgi:hypothetical protein